MKQRRTSPPPAYTLHPRPYTLSFPKSEAKSFRSCTLRTLGGGGLKRSAHRRKLKADESKPTDLLCRDRGIPLYEADAAALSGAPPTQENAMTRLTNFPPRISFALCGLFLGTLTAAACAQEPNPTSVPAPARAAVVTQNGDVFFYKVNVVRRDIDAVNYLHRSGETKLDFAGTELLPGGHGSAVVKSERGGITISADFKGLTPANGFGQEYLTYVLWAISPDGRPQNLGEVLPAGTKNNITVTTALQSFGLIVTAEPYFSVSTPSELIVLKNIVVNDQTNGVVEKVVAHTTLLPPKPLPDPAPGCGLPRRCAGARRPACAGCRCARLPRPARPRERR